MQFLDAAKEYYAAQSSKDLKITLGNGWDGHNGADALSVVLGISKEEGKKRYARIAANHNSGIQSTKLAFRRTEGPSEGCIGFHVDGGYATCTVQIALNDDSEYDGGKLCFVTQSVTTSKSVSTWHTELHVPKRFAGTMTVHPASTLHAVTKLHKGVRYSLFVVDYNNGLGESGVKCVAADTIKSILEQSSNTKRKRCEIE